MRAAALFVLLASATTADEARRDRIAEISEARDTRGEIEASFSDCILKTTIRFQQGCEMGGSVVEVTETFDFSTLLNSQPRLAVEGDGTTQLVYELRPRVRQEILDLGQAFAVVRDEGYRRFPTDVPARLEFFATEYPKIAKEDAMPSGYETTNFCSGSVLTSPQASTLYVYVPTQNRDKFIDLIAAEVAGTCPPPSLLQRIMSFIGSDR